MQGDEQSKGQDSENQLMGSVPEENTRIENPTDQMTVEEAGVASPALPYPLVAVGASAGGLQAFREILENLPELTGMTFVLVTHLAPDQRSYLTEIMERHTRMPVHATEEGQRPEPDNVYILLPNQYVRMLEGRFRLEERKHDDKTPATINTFFRSVAADQKHHAIGIVLSGADSDGASGLKTIKGEGGFALVQTPESATHGAMPRNSIAADHVDLVLPPAEIAIQLARLAHEFKRPSVVQLEEGAAPESDDQAFQKIIRLLRDLSGLELRLYKPATLRRRMARRMMLQRVESLPEYLRLLQTRTDELRRLQEDVLISVTRFFRDPEFWETLQADILPALFQGRPQERPLRIWCAGCSSGEEAYSLAIALLEYTAQHNLDTPIQIFATDASDRAIDMARNAIYPETIAGEISADRIRRFFVKVDRGYQIAKRVRDLCVFARQNLCSDPPFSHVDLLSCRNVMIYFDQILQRQVLATFHYALELGGYLMLGLSEGLRDFGDLFQVVDRKNKMYRKANSSLQDIEFSRVYQSISRSPVQGQSLAPEQTWPELELQRTADRIALARFAPPGMVVDERMNVLQLRGQMSGFLQPAPGPVSWNLQRVLRPNIATGVWQAVQKAINEGIAVATSFLFNEGHAQKHLHIDVLPISGASSERTANCFLIFLRELDADASTYPELPVLSAKLTDDERDRIMSQQEEDLANTRLHLQSLIQERDGRNQELISANEEIQAANEELQSTNEELGTTKEELQSANEELQTVNDELQQRNQVLSSTGNDLNNLLTSINIPLLMLSSDLRIRQFTPPMRRLLNVRPTDVGRSISEMRLHLTVDNLEKRLLEVLETLNPQEVEVQDDEGQWFLLRVRPYRTAEDKIEGLVLVLMDIDLLRKSQQEIAYARDFARAVIECAPLPLLVSRRDMTLQTANSAFYSIAGVRPHDIINRFVPDLFQKVWGISWIQQHLEAVLSGEYGSSFEMEHESPSTQQIMLIRAQSLESDGERTALIVVEDITDRRRIEGTLQRDKALLETQVADAADMLSHTQGELRSLTAHLFNIQEEERQMVARELHDDVSQRLSYLSLLLSEISNQPESADRTARMENARDQVQAINTDVRLMSHQLHPAMLEELGLSAALKALVDEFGEHEAMPASYASQNVPFVQAQPAATAIYRITQEALRNVAKHAGKTHVKVLLEGRDNRLCLQVVDLGIGFDEADSRMTHGLGLISMKERAHMAHGTFSITSRLGLGTTVTVEVPLYAAS